MKKYFSVALLCVSICSCSAFEPLKNAIYEDPYKSLLIATESQIKAARDSFYALDAAAITTCKNKSATPDDGACLAERCSESACLQWRVEVDPRIHFAYSTALAAYQNKDQAMETLIVGSAWQAYQEFNDLAHSDPKRSEMWRMMADTIKAAIGEVQP